MASGSTSRAAASSERSGCEASSAVTRSVSLVERSPALPGSGELAAVVAQLVDQLGELARCWSGCRCGRARWSRLAVARKVGWAFSQTLGAGGGVAGVADGQVAAAATREVALVEDLGDQAHVLVDEDLAAVADRDARPTPARGAAGRRGRSR